MNPPNFDIKPAGTVSQAFLANNITCFEQACNYVTNLPYGRNQDKNNLLTVFADKCGTCSTKHALLKCLADENGMQGFKLMLGLFKMNGLNSRPAAKVLDKYGLDYIPEAHNYLRYENDVIDCTAAKPLDFLPDLLEEIEIQPDQITGFKVDRHKSYLDRWRRQTDLRYDLDELWNIREACIAALAGI